MDYRQKNQLEWLVIAEFVVNNKMYSATKMSLFIVNYRRELKIKTNIRRKGKVEKTMEFAKRMKKVQKEAETVLRKVQEEMKRQVDKRRIKAEEWKKEDKVILSIKDLVFKERLVKKLVD